MVVERSAPFSENWVAGGGGGSVNKGMSLRIMQGSAEAPSVWSECFVPILLDIDPKTREWVIVATFYHCGNWYELGKPKLPYVEFCYREGRWTRQALTDQWIGHPANVLALDPGDKAHLTNSKVLTVERKEAIVKASAMAPKYQRVMERWRTGC